MNYPLTYLLLLVRVYLHLNYLTLSLVPNLTFRPDIQTNFWLMLIIAIKTWFSFIFTFEKYKTAELATVTVSWLSFQHKNIFVQFKLSFIKCLSIPAQTKDLFWEKNYRSFVTGIHLHVHIFHMYLCMNWNSNYKSLCDRNRINVQFKVPFGMWDILVQLKNPKGCY